MTFRIRHEHIPADGTASLSIALLSDLHVWTGARLLDRLDGHLREDPPDVVALTGDLFDVPAGARLVASFLRTIGMRYPVVFVLGNHDRFWGRRYWEPLASIPGCHFLSQKPFQLATPAGGLFEFVDLSRPGGRLDPRTVRIGLAHSPEKIPSHGFPEVRLALAGHLHGGQFVFWTDRHGSLYPGSFAYRHLADRKRLGTTQLVVSRGLGDTLPLRWNCPREVVRIRLGG